MKPIGWLLLAALAVIPTMPGTVEAATGPKIAYIQVANNGGPKKLTKTQKNFTAKPYKFKKWKAPKAGKVQKWTK
jgi:hypothetical protein